MDCAPLDIPDDNFNKKIAEGYEKILGVLDTWKLYVWGAWIFAGVIGVTLHPFITKRAATWLFLNTWPLPEKTTATDVAVHQNLAITFSYAVTCLLILSLAKVMCLLFLSDLKMQTRTRLFMIAEHQIHLWLYIKNHDPGTAKWITYFLGDPVEWLRPPCIDDTLDP